jgi:hypothetical protein
MSEPTVDGTSTIRPPTIAGLATGWLNVGGEDVRVDAAHPAIGPAAEPSARAVGRNAQALLEAVQSLQSELAQQVEREDALRWQAEQLERDRHGWLATQQRRQADLDAFDAMLRQQREALDARQHELIVHVEALSAAERQLTADRDHLRSALLEELQAERVEVSTAQAELNAERAALSQEHARLAAEHERIQERVDQQLQSERQHLWESLTLEWQQRREMFDAERSVWETQTAAIRQQLDEQQRHYANLVAGWEQELSRSRAELAHELHEQRTQAEAECAAELSAQRAHLATQQAEFHRERVLLDNRLRFQQEHLEKARLDLERAQADFRAERQQERQRLEDDTRQLERRQQQFRVYRETLDELVRTLDREHETVLKCRAAWTSAVDVDRQSLDGERDLWDQDRQRQQTELARQQELLVQQHERLESRQLRLERLRAELEDTHRTTLELRLAVEETWAQIAHAVGSDEQARVQVEQARQSLVLYYQQLHAVLADHRRELAEQQAWFDQQRHDFHEERQTVLHWLNERDEQLRSEEARQLAAAAELATHDAAWQAARDEWLAEKLEAERVIRRLVTELADGALGDNGHADMVSLTDDTFGRAA